jgi:hypothetical protein
MSDTLERMLRPQGLFQGMQPRPFDWQQTYAAPVQTPQPDPGQYGQPPYPGGGYGAPEWGAAPYGPGQYPPGDFGNAQYPQDQYAQGQYGQGQYPSGQYGQAQYPSGQFPPGQLPPGQYPPAGYGPGGQFGPAGPPADSGRRSLGFGKARVNLPRGPLVPAVVAATLVVIVAVAVVLVVQNNSPSNAGTGASATTSPTATSSAAAVAESQAATQLEGLLAQSGNDRADVGAAAGNVDACQDLAASAREFSKAATNRKTLLAKLAQLPERSALPNAMLADIRGGWQASATVDEDLAKWASKAATGGCTKATKKDPSANSKDPNLNASYMYDTIATTDKTAFVKLWNPLARKDGLPTYTIYQL